MKNPLNYTNAADYDSFLFFNTPILAQEYFAKPQYLPNPLNLPIFNASVENFDNRYIFISRCSNILNYADGNYFYVSNPHRTINIIHNYDYEFNFINYEILDDSFLISNFECAQFGVEDIRLFKRDNELWGIGAAISESEKRRTITQILFKIEGNKIVLGYPIFSPHGRVYEKNWAPLVKDNSLYLVYSINPLEIYQESKGVLSKKITPDLISSEFSIKGSTPFIKLYDKWLGIVHSGPYKFNNRLFYTHQFCLLDSGFKLMDLSAPFFIQRRGIEFACGLIKNDSNLLLSYGVSDRGSAFLKLNEEQLMQWIVLPPR